VVTRTGARAASRSGRLARERLRDDLERLCQDAAVSQRVLAEASGVPQPYLSRILAGTARPSLETYARLSAALGADLSAHIYPNTGPAIRDRLSVPILEHLLAVLHPRWRPSTEVRVTRPGRGWIDVVLHEERERIVVATEIQSTLNRIEQLVRWSAEKADSLPSWDRWPDLPDRPTISRLLIVRWTRSTRDVAREAARQLRVAYPAHPADALAALTGSTAWPGPALLWARANAGEITLLGDR
jgi:transcriptional regulator with XRE-family HTH domain